MSANDRRPVITVSLVCPRNTSEIWQQVADNSEVLKSDFAIFHRAAASTHATIVYVDLQATPSVRRVVLWDWSACTVDTPKKRPLVVLLDRTHDTVGGRADAFENDLRAVFEDVGVDGNAIRFFRLSALATSEQQEDTYEAVLAYLEDIVQSDTDVNSRQAIARIGALSPISSSLAQALGDVGFEGMVSAPIWGNSGEVRDGATMKLVWPNRYPTVHPVTIVALYQTRKREPRKIGSILPADIAHVVFENDPIDTARQVYFWGQLVGDSVPLIHRAIEVVPTRSWSGRFGWIEPTLNAVDSVEIQSPQTPWSSRTSIRSVHQQQSGEKVGYTGIIAQIAANQPWVMRSSKGSITMFRALLSDEKSD